jgi:hypothetical protein
MNRQAEKHLLKAEGLLARGDGFYHQAVDAILAAQEADPTLSQREIGEWFGHHGTWVGRLVTWHTNGSAADAPFARGEGEKVRKDREAALRALREAPLEQVEQIVASLPAKQAAKLAQAALGKTGVTRELAKDADASAAVTRASGKIREEMEHETRTRRSRGGVVQTVGFLVEVLGDLLSAKRKLNDSYTAARDHELTDDQAEAIEEVLQEVVTIVDWYRSYLNSGDQSFEEELSKLLHP